MSTIERQVPKPSAWENFTGATALITGVPLAAWMLINLLDLEVGFIATLPADLIDGSLFFLAAELHHSAKSRRLNRSVEDLRSHQLVKHMREAHGSIRARQSGS